MRTAIGIDAIKIREKSAFKKFVAFVGDAAKLGVHSVWTGEAWGTDAVSQLAYIAATVPTIKVGSSILQISARVPAMTAMTAMTMAAITEDRFILGLGVSGPQVVEGLHGQPFAHPLGRLKEYIDILKLAFSGEKLVYSGKHYVLPRPGGEGKALRLAQPANTAIPIYLATLGPRALEYTGEIADGWLGTSFTPEGADYYWAHLRAGAARRGRKLDAFDVQISIPTYIGEDVEGFLARRKRAIAFQLGAMGSPKTNFYNTGYRRIGFEDAAIEIQRLWTAGRHDEAYAAVPTEMALQTSLAGTETMIRERIRKYKQAGVTTLHLQPSAESMTERLDVIGRVTEWVKQESARPQ